MSRAEVGTTGLVMREPLVFERSAPGRIGISLPEPPESGEVAIPEAYRRSDPPRLPEVSEPDVIRHFTRMSQWNYGVDTGFYPLGSCTMKYNPKINEELARLPGFTALHPYMPESWVQGALQLMHELERYLAEIGGFAAVTLQPAAGAHGEFAGMAMIRSYHDDHGNPRSKVLIPETAHGTNPASCVLNGYRPVQIRCGSDGWIEPEDVAREVDDQVAAIMVTNPNTLGLFETRISEIADILHGAGALVYCDGANMNSLMGEARPGDMGVDVLQFNLHKTFSTPHGGGGPGSGPVGVSAPLEPYLPVPRIVERDQTLSLDWDRPQSIGAVKGFYGHFSIMVRAYAYIRELGPEGLRHATRMAVLNANYLRSRLRERYQVAYDRPCMHECVLSDKGLSKLGIQTLDVAKWLIDRGFHPPTVYFPLCVQGALMIEPTETESRDTLDAFVEAMFAVLDEAEEDPESVHAAPQKPVVGRLDEVSAARRPVLRWTPDQPPTQ